MIASATNGYKREDEIYTHKYAAKSASSKGRQRELDQDHRTEYQRDAHRISYSQPFRRLRHKTQVFYLPNNDHISTRLEHALFVSSAARTIARALKLNEDLAEAIGLGHDLGHTPFGHHGGQILGEICRKSKLSDVFDHEVNSLRVVDRLAQLDREPMPGLALTYEVRDGIVSHNGEEFTQWKIEPYQGEKNLESIETKFDAKNPITLEGCIVRMVDKVAYAGRDTEDGIQAKLIKEEDIPKEITKVLGRNNGSIVGTLISDIIENTPLDENYIAMSRERFEALTALIKFNYKEIYENEKVQLYKTQARNSMTILFENFLDALRKTRRFQDKGAIIKNVPKVFVYDTFKKFLVDMNYDDKEKDEQIVVDFISGFTDNFVLRALDEVFIPKAIDTPPS